MQYFFTVFCLHNMDNVHYDKYLRIFMHKNQHMSNINGPHIIVSFITIFKQFHSVNYTAFISLPSSFLKSMMLLQTHLEENS